MNPGTLIMLLKAISVLIATVTPRSLETVLRSHRRL